jgi:hypothetical protein
LVSVVVDHHRRHIFTLTHGSARASSPAFCGTVLHYLTHDASANLFNIYNIIEEHMCGYNTNVWISYRIIIMLLVSLASHSDPCINTRAARSQSPPIAHTTPTRPQWRSRGVRPSSSSP